MTTANVFTDVRQLTRFTSDYFQRQIPFAVQGAINATAKIVAAAENADLAKELDNPTPFTQRTFRIVSRASKSNLTAIVDAMPIQAAYLTPVATGGTQIVKKTDTLRGRNITLTSYGNLPQGVIGKYANKPGVFIGTVKFKDGNVISGVWQRPVPGPKRAGGRGRRGKAAKGIGQQTGLKLLIAFNPPKTVKETLHTGRVAAGVVAAQFNIQMRRTLAQAIATAR